MTSKLDDDSISAQIAHCILTGNKKQKEGIENKTGAGKQRNTAAQAADNGEQESERHHLTAIPIIKIINDAFVHACIMLLPKHFYELREMHR